MRKLLATMAAVLAVGGMAACSSNPDEATVTVTKASTSKSRESKEPKSSMAKPTEAANDESAAPSHSEEPTAASAENASSCLVGSFGQPQFQGTQCLDKQIASCAPADGSYEMGTTFFTDGTSGWTQVCGDQMVAQYVPPTQNWSDQSSGEDFSGPFEPASPSPTFDPNSADGYGPNQELPPFCDRFPDHETC